ncbi:hypothetical protein CQW23_26470 [Capsicum baccatum]|uniref:Uncharacterized protein n=1 Tax=Capsicum baccatum TaxID=33114 RepID=A0A2G2VNW2_CAPBA|nr:hypothetical protein CQW23_26470 [Capsicum baccatum]
MKTSLEKADEAIEKVREGVKHIKHSEGRILKFVECIKNHGLSCSKKLRQDVTTHWNSTYQMLDSSLFYQQAYVQYKFLDVNFKYSIFEEEWKKVEVTAKFFRPFNEITTLFSSSKYPTANLNLPNEWKIQILAPLKEASVIALWKRDPSKMNKFLRWPTYFMEKSVRNIDFSPDGRCTLFRNGTGVEMAKGSDGYNIVLPKELVWDFGG